MSLLQRNLITGVNPVIQEWMSAVNRRQLSTFIPTITVTEGEVSVYLVNKRPGQPAGSSTSTSATRKTPATKRNEDGSKTEAKTQSPKKSAEREPIPLRAPSPKRASKAKEVVKSPVTPMETSPQMSSPGASEVYRSDELERNVLYFSQTSPGFYVSAVRVF